MEESKKNIDEQNSNTNDLNEDCKKCEECGECNNEDLEVEKEVNIDSNEENKSQESADDDLSLKLKEAEDKYKRLLAEFDNFRKRNEKEKSLMFSLGATSILTKVLPIVDNFERALSSVKDDIKENTFVVGIENIYKQIENTFKELDVEPIKAVGEKFDANLHNAVLTDEKGEGEEGTITEELQKGYKYKGEVLRHSMVKVKK